MGVERSVTRWYVQRQCILDEIETLQATLAAASKTEDNHSDTVEQEDADVRLQLTKTQEKLGILGPCPKPMMG